MSNASLQIQMPGVDFEKMAREMIAAKLTEALSLSDAAIQSLVTSALTRKVNEHGNVGQYSSDNKIAFVEWVAMDLIRKVTLDIVAAKTEALRPTIAIAVERELKRSTSQIAKALVEGFTDKARGARYSIGLTFSINNVD